MSSVLQHNVYAIKLQKSDDMSNFVSALGCEHMEMAGRL